MWVCELHCHHTPFHLAISAILATRKARCSSKACGFHEQNLIQQKTLPHARCLSHMLRPTRQTLATENRRSRKTVCHSPSQALLAGPSASCCAGAQCWTQVPFSLAESESMPWLWVSRHTLGVQSLFLAPPSEHREPETSAGSPGA